MGRSSRRGGGPRAVAVMAGAWTSSGRPLRGEEKRGVAPVYLRRPCARRFVVCACGRDARASIASMASGFHDSCVRILCRGPRPRGSRRPRRSGATRRTMPLDHALSSDVRVAEEAALARILLSHVPLVSGRLYNILDYGLHARRASTIRVTFRGRGARLAIFAGTSQLPL